MATVRSGVNITGTLGAGGGAVKGTVTAYRDMSTILKREANKIMKDAAKIIFNQAKMNIHNDTGALSASGRIVLEDTPKGTRAAIRFGGDDFPVTPTRNTRGGVTGDGVVDYAFFIHEGISPSGKGASSGVKFLERAVMSTQTQVKDLVTQRLKKATKLKRGRRK